MVKITYSILHDESPSYLYSKLVPVTHGNRHTRATDAGDLLVPRTKTRYDTYAYSYQGPLQWNLTSIELKAAVNKMQLKNLLKTSWG